MAGDRSERGLLANVTSYTRLSDEAVTRTIEIEPAVVMVDVDAEGRAVGIEVIGGTFDMTIAWGVIRAAHFGRSDER